MAKYNTVKLQVKKGELKDLSQKSNAVQEHLDESNVIYIYHGSKSKKIYVGQTKHFIQRNAHCIF